MEEIISKKHKNPPATHNRNRQRIPIDGIFISSHTKIHAAGYTSFDESHWTDHRVLWVEIKVKELFGYPHDDMAYQQPRRLTCDSLQKIEKFNSLVTKSFNEHNLFLRAENLEQQFSISGWTPTLEKEYNDIQACQLRLRKLAESKTRKLRMGERYWSPGIGVLMNKLKFYKILLQNKRYGKTDKKFMKRFAKRLKIPHPWFLDETSILDTLRSLSLEAKRDFPQSKQLRDTFLDQLAMEKAEKNETLFEKERKKLTTINYQQNSHAPLNGCSTNLTETPRSKSSPTRFSLMEQQKRSNATPNKRLKTPVLMKIFLALVKRTPLPPWLHKLFKNWDTSPMDQQQQKF